MNLVKLFASRSFCCILVEFMKLIESRFGNKNKATGWLKQNFHNTRRSHFLLWNHYQNLEFKVCFIPIAIRSMLVLSLNLARIQMAWKVKNYDYTLHVSSKISNLSSNSKLSMGSPLHIVIKGPLRGLFEGWIRIFAWLIEIYDS